MYVVICIGVQAMACDLNVMHDWYWFMVWNGIWSDFWHSQELCGLRKELNFEYNVECRMPIV